VTRSCVGVFVRFRAPLHQAQRILLLELVPLISEMSSFTNPFSVNFTALAKRLIRFVLT
jgi:hypothetical protein